MPKRTIEDPNANVQFNLRIPVGLVHRIEIISAWDRKPMNQLVTEVLNDYERTRTDVPKKQITHKKISS